VCPLFALLTDDNQSRSFSFSLHFCYSHLHYHRSSCSKIAILSCLFRGTLHLLVDLRLVFGIPQVSDVRSASTWLCSPHLSCISTSIMSTQLSWAPAYPYMLHAACKYTFVLIKSASPSASCCTRHALSQRSCPPAFGGDLLSSAPLTITRRTLPANTALFSSIQPRLLP
jgi:hypothetical protein